MASSFFFWELIFLPFAQRRNHPDSILFLINSNFSYIRIEEVIQYKIFEIIIINFRQDFFVACKASWQKRMGRSRIRVSWGCWEVNQRSRSLRALSCVAADKISPLSRSSETGKTEHGPFWAGLILGPYFSRAWIYPAEPYDPFSGGK